MDKSECLDTAPQTVFWGSVSHHLEVRGTAPGNAWRRLARTKRKSKKICMAPTPKRQAASRIRCGGT